MSKKKPATGTNRQSGAKKPGAASKQPATKKGGGKQLWMIGAAVVLVAIVAVALMSTKSQKATVSASSAPADEQKYMGRYLTAGFQEPVIAGKTTYSSTLQMSDVQAQTGKEFSISKADVAAKKIVYFEYPSSQGAIPMIAYVKPSGKLFLGVSYCIPCQGKKQRIEADGTLTCESCGTKRDLETGVGTSGACKLYPLDEIPSKIAGDKIVIDKTVLDKWTPQPKDRPIGG